MLAAVEQAGETGESLSCYSSRLGVIDYNVRAGDGFFACFV